MASSFNTPALSRAAEGLASVEDRVAAIRVLMHLHPGMNEVRTQRTGRDLQPQAIERHGIVLAHLAVLLLAQDFGQIDIGNGNKRRSLLLRLDGETSSTCSSRWTDDRAQGVRENAGR